MSISAERREACICFFPPQIRLESRNADTLPQWTDALDATFINARYSMFAATRYTDTPRTRTICTTREHNRPPSMRTSTGYHSSCTRRT